MQAATPALPGQLPRNSLIPMTPRALLALLLFGMSVSWTASAIEVVRVWPGYRTDSSFESIGQYFGREEHKGGRILVRSRPENRDGYYFLTRLRSAPASPGAVAQIDIIFPGSDLAQTFRLPLDLPAGGSVLQLGVTGEDWPSAAIKPLAWRLTLLAADGTRLVESQSFLWSQP